MPDGQIKWMFAVHDEHGNVVDAKEVVYKGS